MSTIDNIYLEELGVYVTYDPIGPFYSNEIMNKMDKFHFALQEGRNIKIGELEKICRKYPHVPQFKNYLASVYTKHNLWDKHKTLVEQIRKEHPDYLFGRINQVEYYLEHKEYDKIPEILGDGLKSLYPHKEIFHETELSSYYAVSIFYYKEIGNEEKEKFCFDILEQVNPDHPLLYKRTIELMQENLKKLELERKAKRKVEETGYDKSVQTTDEPVFHHKEIWDLYKYGHEIPIELLELILLLPRENCIEDLKLVLEDSIRRYEFFTDNQQNFTSAQIMFPEHALYLLVELKATESLGQIFRLLDQGGEFLAFWYGDALDEVFNEVLYKIDHQNLDRYKEFILSPYKFTYARTIMSNVVREVYYNYPDRREDIINWYQEVYEHFLNNLEEDSLIDSDLIGLMAWANTSMNLVEVEPQLKHLWDKGLIPPSMMGNWEDIVESLHNKDKEYRERIKLFSLAERYEYIGKKWFGSDAPLTFPGSDPIKAFLNAYDDEYPNFRDNSTKIRATPKIGRNAPCPCGSGKKYKKCCLGK